MNLLFGDLLITHISFLNNRDRHFLSEKGASETDTVTVILSPRHPACSVTLTEVDLKGNETFYIRLGRLRQPCLVSTVAFCK